MANDASLAMPLVQEQELDEEESKSALPAPQRLLNSPVKGPLSRFAYDSAPSSRPSHHAPPRPIPVSKAPPADLPNSQLVRLSRCVVCRLQWTSNKSAKQKRTHIEQCAKKNALTTHTVKFLIEKEFVPNNPNENATATLMDSVVPTGPAKKLRRQQVIPTVRSLPETRESILDRARDVLGSANAQAGPHPTQRFGQSALARRETRQSTRPALLDADACIEELPLTQPFGASSLSGGAKWSVNGYEGSSFLLAHQVGASTFAQDSILSSDRVRTFV